MTGEEQRKVIERYRKLRLDVLYPFDEEKEKEFKSTTLSERILKSRADLEVCEEQLKEVDERTINTFKSEIINGINKLEEIIDASIAGHPLSLNQGTVIEKAVYGKFIRLLQIALSNAAVSYGQFFYTTEEGKQLDSEPVKSVLGEWKEVISQKAYSEYTALETDVESLIGQIYDLRG